MNQDHFRCIACGATHSLSLIYECEACSGILDLIRANPSVSPSALVSERVGLGEGNTPLLSAPVNLLGHTSFTGELWLKDETRNPSGSFKDRHVSAALTAAIALGTPGVVCASSGNAGASAAAYAARAGLPAIIVVPERTPLEKVTQITAYGAHLVKVAGNYSKSYDLALHIARECGYVNLTTTYINPFGTDALRLVGHELVDQLNGEIPDWVFVPTGAGPLVKGVVQGFADKGKGMPKVVAVQAEGCAPVVQAFNDGASQVTAWGEPATIASGISDPLIGYEKDGTYTLDLVRSTGGCAISVSDQQIRDAMQCLARGAGVFAEPTAASALAAASQMVQNGQIAPDARIVCMITGHGFKDFKIYRDMPVTQETVSSGEDIERFLASLRPGEA